MAEEEEVFQQTMSPPVPKRPRIVQRMMLRTTEDTMLPWESYTNTANILRSHQEPLRSNSTAINLFRKRGILGDEFAFSWTSKRNRIFPTTNEVNKYACCLYYGISNFFY